MGGLETEKDKEDMETGEKEQKDGGELKDGGKPKDSGELKDSGEPKDSGESKDGGEPENAGAQQNHGGIFTIKKQADRMKKRREIRYVITFFAILISAILQAYVIQVFIRPAQILSGGFTGIAILVDMLTSRYGINFPTSLGMLVINVPVAFICFKSIGARFTGFSLLQVIFTSSFLQLFHFKPIFDDSLLNVVFGGFLLGLSVVTALRGNASSGGTDFIALFVSNKTGKSIWSYVFAGNCVLYCIFGLLFGWRNAAYSILVQFISTKTISTFHHRYDRVTLQITTEKADQIMTAYISRYRHGISCVDAIGGYSRKPMSVLHTVVSSYEASDVIYLMREVDPHVIINVFKTEQFYGKFYRAPIE